ncbi:MAG: DegT/DnrJ/EryC1/StrS family aminotransferase [Deltaproteobacteria bacterium]|nr:DegT/DnrJ/EryC1/StrS family aminotransferase [Deltaproteobacteria bacterium]
MPKAVVPTDLYGQCCDLSRIVEICDRYGVPVVCDSAEALGARYRREEVGGRGTEGRGRGTEDGDRKRQRRQGNRKEMRGERGNRTRP